ncbi:uncharacterized protein LOC123261206 isoform X1 [Cotesia glomerata]|uniref:uncharacterized protein LOC123261206 isoform X1 n=1 Tax=Cotesia glomerata TaxID=32391 RepID=UPI001D01DCBA|nr:uncharacterized protein LOC123261206 isoform X1 [Cotesia glomerata]
MEKCNNTKGQTTNRRYPLSVENKIYDNDNGKNLKSISDKYNKIYDKILNITSDCDNSQDFVLQVTNSIFVKETSDENNINHNNKKTQEVKSSEVIIISDSSDDESFSPANNKGNTILPLKKIGETKRTPSLTISSIDSSDILTEDESHKKSKTNYIFTSTQLNNDDRRNNGSVSNDSGNGTPLGFNYLSEKDLRTPTINQIMRSESLTKLPNPSPRNASADRRKLEPMSDKRDRVLAETKGSSVDKVLSKQTNDARIIPGFTKRNPATPVNKKATREILKAVKSKRIVYDSPGQWQKNKAPNNYNSPGLMRGRDIINKSELETSNSSSGSKKEDQSEFQHPAWIDETTSEVSDSQENDCDNKEEDCERPAINVTETRVIGYLNPIERQSLSPSERKKEDIARWLMSTAFDQRSDTSLSVIGPSQPNSPGSGNSSLERLEQNYQTPNNRAKFQAKINSATSGNTKTNDNTPITGGHLKQLEPVQRSKVNTPSTGDVKRLEPARKKNVDRNTPNLGGNLKPSTSNTPSTGGNFKRSEPGRSRVTTPSSGGNLKRLEPVDKKNLNTPSTGGNSKSLNKPVQKTMDNFVKKTKPRPRTSKNLTPLSITKTATKTLRSDDQATNDSSNTNTPSLRIEDCEDILTRLYGDSWRKNADALLPKESRTAPRTDKVKKKVHDTARRRSDKIVKSIKPVISRKEKKVPPNVRNIRDSFINDWPSSEDDAVETSFVTALSTPIPPSHTIRRKETPMSELQKKVIEICDSDSDDDKTPVVKNTRKRLSFGDDKSSGSFTSEYDPGEVILPKPVSRIKNLPTSKLSPVVFKQPAVTVSFIKSLSKEVALEKVHPEAKKYRLNYKLTKDELCQRLYKIFNEKVFDSQLPKNMSIEWNARMRRTAGFCYNKMIRSAIGKPERSSRIVLSTKILDEPNRLRDTLIHEMCHAATWLINEISDGHGIYWRSWASKALKVFPELPPITRCHDYKITTKYTYRCVDCGYSIGRHSKSLDISRKRCGHCFGKFELLVNRTTRSGRVELKTPNAKQPSGFALFVKENYGSVRKECKDSNHQGVMKILGQQFSAVKISKQNDKDDN